MLIQRIASKEVTKYISANGYKTPTVLTTTIGELKKIINLNCNLIIFGMKNPNKLLTLSVNGNPLSFHKLWYLFMNDLNPSQIFVENENDEDKVIIGLGFSKPEELSSPYLMVWGANVGRDSVRACNQYLFMVADGTIVQRYS